jgi:hypothetical protein
MPRAAPRISSAVSDGTAPPSRASTRIEIVPPVNSATIDRGAARRSAITAAGGAAGFAPITRTARSHRSRSAPRR